MSVESASRAPISRLDDLPTLERRLVICARLWQAGAAGRTELGRGLTARHGPAIGKATEDRLDELLQMVCAHSRRRVELSPVGAEGASGDECVLARLVALAAEGECEEAILISALLIRADLALELARRAMALGHLMLRRPGALALLLD